MNLHLHSITFEDITCIHTYIHTSIHPSIHTYIHTMCACVCVCRIFDIQYDSRLAYSSIYSHGCRCSNRILCNSLIHIETRISGLGALAFLFVRDCSLIFGYIQIYSEIQLQFADKSDSQYQKLYHVIP